MASFLTDLVKPYVEKLINGAITESSYICCFTCIAKDFEDEKARLEVERTTFKQRVDEATRRGEDVQANALFWEKEAAELIQQDTKTKQKCFFGFCCHCIWRYKRGKELTNKKEQIKKLMETGKELAIGLPTHLPDVDRYSSQHYIPFKSRESKYKELLDALNDDNNYIVGLQGMGGTGKTTLAMEVGKKLKQSKQFTQVIDTAVSFSPDIKKIQDDIAGPLGLKFDDCNESDRPKKLWSRLTNGEKILLILDDVWGDIDFIKIGIPESDNRKGCSVLTTTRNLSVCNRLGCSRTIQLDLLSEEDAWIMFQRHAGLSDVSTKNLRDRGHKIANECKRLPIAIAAIASSLKGEQRREKWDVALYSLQKHVPIDGVDKDMVDIYKCLKFSYDYLKDENAMELFLLCSVFQEDEEISIKILTRLGIGAGLFGERYDKYNNARNLVVVAKDKLLDSCLLLKAYKGGVKMHDLIREVAQWIASKEILVVDFSNKNQKSLVGRDNNIKYLSFHGNPMDLCSCGFDGSKLKILIFIMDKGCFVDVQVSFFENIARLRVLNLIGHYQILPLPHSIGLLTNIRSLLIERADLGDISVLGSLQSLETLDLNCCEIDKLPEEIAKLKELRLLNLENCRIKRNNPFEVIQRCPSLEELYFWRSFNDFCREITLPATLERYHLDQDYHMRDNSSLSKCVCLNNDYLSEATFKYVMQTTEFLKLESIEKVWTNIMPEIVPIDEGMNDLIELRLQYDSQLQYLIDTEHIGSQVPNVFSKLVVLELERMNNLQELCNGPISLDFMNSLEELTITSCGKLRSLFKGNILNLCNLKTVYIYRCSTLVSVFHLSPSGCLPQLEKLIIRFCDHLENIFTYERSVDDVIEEILLPKLKVVDISFCDKLTYIFDHEVKLASLIELELDNVPNFIDIFPESYDSIEGSSNSISKQETQLQLQEEPIKSNILSCCYRFKSTKVPSEDHPQASSISTETSSYCLNIWKSAQCLSRLSHIICNIKVIKLVSVSKIKSVFILSIAPKMLLLESLTIEDCRELEHIVVDIGDGSGIGVNIVFPKLKQLNVENCEKLKYIFGYINASDDHDQNNNEIQLHLPALKSLSLKYLSRLIGLCPKQYHTTFPLLEGLQLIKCSPVNVKSIGDFTFHTSISRCQDCTTIKQFNGNMEHFLAVVMLNVSESNVESILCLNEESEREIDLGLQTILLRKLPMMIYLFVGPKNAFALKNLERVTIFGCEKLEMVFSISVLRCLSQLSYLTIEECNELKHIIEEDDIENAMNSKTCCFPILKTLAIVKCNKLKSVFPISMRKELPELKVMLIRDADKLEGIFKSVGDDQKIEIPNLEVVGFVNLPSLCHVQGIKFQAVKNRLVHNCKKLSLVTSLTSEPYHVLYHIVGRDNFEVIELFLQLKHEIEVQVEAEHMLISSQELISEQSTSQQHLLGEIDNTFPETKNVPPLHLVDLKQKGVHVEGIVLILDQGEYVDIEGSLERTQINNQGSLNDGEIFFVNIPDLNIPEVENSEVIVATKMKQIAEANSQDDVVDDEDWLETCKTSNQFSHLKLKLEMLRQVDYNLPNERDLETTEDVAAEVEVQATSEHMLQLCLPFQEYGNGQIDIPFPVLAIECLNIEDVNLGGSHETTQTNNQVSLNDDAFMQVSSTIQQQFPKDDEIIVSGLGMPSTVNSPPNSQELMNEQPMHQQRLKNQERPLGEIDATIKSSQVIKLSVEDITTSVPNARKSRCEDQSIQEGSTSKTRDYLEDSRSTIPETKNVPPVHLVDLKQKGIHVGVEEGTASTSHANTITSSGAMISIEEGTTSIHDKNITSSTHVEDVEGEICMPSFSIVNTKPPATKDVDVGDSQETIAMEVINNLIEEDPLLALEKLLTGQVSISSVRILLQELKTLMDSSSDLDHLVSNQESKSKLISLFHQLNQHQGMLTSDLKDFVQNVQNFFNKNIIKQATSEQVSKKHNQLLDSKTNLMNKLWSAKSTQAHIDSETSTANVQIDELSLQIDELRIKLEDLENQREGLKSVVNKCDVQKKNLKAECTEWAQQSKDLISALASSKVDVKEDERARNLEKEGFAKLKSLFPTF